jgi:hypothetical protein
MKLEPLRGWVIGRIAITRMSSAIIAPDVTRGVTKFVLLEAVSPEAAKVGLKPGDLVMAKTMHNIFLQGGKFHRVTFPIDELICVLRDVALNELIGSDGNPLEEAPAVAAAAAA